MDGDEVGPEFFLKQVDGDDLLGVELLFEINFRLHTIIIEEVILLLLFLARLRSVVEERCASTGVRSRGNGYPQRKGV